MLEGSLQASLIVSLEHPQANMVKITLGFAPLTPAADSHHRLIQSEYARSLDRSINPSSGPRTAQHGMTPSIASASRMQVYLKHLSSSSITRIELSAFG